MFPHLSAHQKTDLLARVLGELVLRPDDPMRTVLRIFPRDTIRVVAVQLRNGAWVACIWPFDKQTWEVVAYGAGLQKLIAVGLFPHLDPERYATVHTDLDLELWR